MAKTNHSLLTIYWLQVDDEGERGKATISLRFTYRAVASIGEAMVLFPPKFLLVSRSQDTFYHISTSMKCTLEIQSSNLLEHSFSLSISFKIQ
jgi:hypothetical protein